MKKSTRVAFLEEEIEMRKLLMLALLGMGLLAPGARAAPITGEVHFAGLWTPSGGPIATATGIDFSTFQVVLDGTGTYAGLAGTVATFNDFTFTPFPGSVVPLWSFSSGGVDYSFDLRSVSSPPVFQSGTELALTGAGVLHATGFDDIAADWDFTGNAGSVLFSFSADNVAVPEPASIGLLALGLMGLTAVGTRQARRLG
jgi:hypothetical protein